MRYLLILFLVTFLANNSIAQGDDCTLATALTVGATCTYTAFSNTENGQPEAGTPNPSCLSGTESSDVWYSFSGTGASLQVSIANLTQNATVAVWSNCPATTQVACMNATTAASNSMTFATAAATTYYIQIIRTSGNTNDNQSGDICVSTPGLVMSNGSTTACSGVFYDSGGTGNYADSQDLTTPSVLLRPEQSFRRCLRLSLQNPVVIT